MEMVLVVAQARRCDVLKKLLPKDGHVFIRAENEKEARMKILDLELSLVIVDAALQGTEAKDVSAFASQQGLDTLMVVPEGLLEYAATMMHPYNVYVAEFSEGSVNAVLNAIQVARSKLVSAQEKNMKLLSRLKNEKVLTQAKCLLAARKGMSEAEAHSCMEKKAMNCRISLADAAMCIIRELS